MASISSSELESIQSHAQEYTPHQEKVSGDGATGAQTHRMMSKESDEAELRKLLTAHSRGVQKRLSRLESNTHGISKGVKRGLRRIRRSTNRINGSTPSTKKPA